MNLRFVEAFYWIAKLGSFSAAAARLHATPAAISERIRTLEEDLGVRVFERDSRRVLLTADGQRLLPFAEQMLHLRDAMRKSVQNAGEQTGIISIGAIETVVHTWLPQVLRELTHAYPRITIELYSDSTPRLKEELRSDQLDIAILADEVEGELFESVPLGSDAMLWVSHPDIAAGIHDAKDFEAALLGQPVITFMRDTPAFRDVRRVLGNIIGVRINPFSSVAGMISVLASGYGIAAMPQRVARAHIAAGQLAEIPHGPRLAPLRLLLARPTSAKEPVVDMVADLVAQVCTRLANVDERPAPSGGSDPHAVGERRGTGPAAGPPQGGPAPSGGSDPHAAGERGGTGPAAGPSQGGPAPSGGSDPHAVGERGGKG